MRGILRNNTLTTLNRKSLSKTTLKHLKHKAEEEKEGTKSSYETSPFRKHPGFVYIKATSPSLNDYKKFVTLLYKGLYYSANNLKGPSQEYIKKKGVKLPEPAGTDRSIQIQKRSS